jgi:phage/plasmid-like protein (TIGR03299 family)
MAHLVETMAYRGETPWHGLGNQLATHQPLEVWAKQAGMNWQIEETPVRFITGKEGTLGQIHNYPDSKVLYRSDTKAPLSVVGNRYKIVQPRDILEFYRDLTEKSGFELETAGVLKGGKKFWALAKTGQSLALKGKDITNGYVLLATACDGTLATTAQFTSVRVVCNNTLAIATANSQGAVKVPHNTTFDAALVKQELGITVSQWDEFMYQLRHLSDRKVNNRGAKTFFQKVFTEKTREGLQTNEWAMKKALHLFEGNGRGSRYASSQNTAYGLLNAVTEYVDHERKARSVDHRLDSAWFGKGAQLKQKAFIESLALVA